jgi:protein-S-isoprenylcysteine O-methyltransferase Ste14
MMIAQTSGKNDAVAAHPSAARLVIGTVLHTVLLPGSLVVALPYWLLQESADAVALSVARVQFLIGALLMMLGATVLGLCFRDFVVSGKGTPNPLHPPRILVSERLYRYIRNPIYVAVITILVGEALAFGAPVLIGYAALVWLVLQGFVVFYEEPTLRRGFGAHYEAYCRAVPRWIPRLPTR